MSSMQQFRILLYEDNEMMNQQVARDLTIEHMFTSSTPINALRLVTACVFPVSGTCSQMVSKPGWTSPRTNIPSILTLRSLPWWKVHCWPSDARRTSNFSPHRSQARERPSSLGQFPPGPSGSSTIYPHVLSSAWESTSGSRCAFVKVRL
jgi:hypothetical protein